MVRWQGGQCRADFYPRPPRGGRQVGSFALSSDKTFLSTPSARRATSDLRFAVSLSIFLSTPSARRATHQDAPPAPHPRYFYPRPPRGGRPSALQPIYQLRYFYPRPPRGGRPERLLSHTSATTFLSTPSARRATSVWYFPSTFLCNFYPRPPRGGRHASRSRGNTCSPISIHALREEGDDSARFPESLRHHISIHALREEGDA